MYSSSQNVDEKDTNFQTKKFIPQNKYDLKNKSPSMNKYSKILNLDSFDNQNLPSLTKSKLLSHNETFKDFSTSVPVKISEILESLNSVKAKQKYKKKVPLLTLTRFNTKAETKEDEPGLLSERNTTKTNEYFYKSSIFNDNLLNKSRKTNELLEKDKMKSLNKIRTDREVSYLHKDLPENISTSLRSKQNTFLLEKPQIKNAVFESPFIPEKHLLSSLYSKRMKNSYSW